MQSKPSLSAVLLLVILLLFQGLAPDLQAQMPPVPTPQELDQLLAPVALYPDALLAQITTASTNPQEILDVDNWLGQNQNLSVSQLTAAAQQQGFDPAFIALVGFPQVIEMMAENIDDYAAIGAAVTADQGQVSAAIQRLRAVKGSAEGMNQVAEAPFSMAASGCRHFPIAITIRQPAVIAMRAAASFVTMPPELWPGGASPAIASISGVSSRTSGISTAVSSLRGSAV